MCAISLLKSSRSLSHLLMSSSVSIVDVDELRVWRLETGDHRRVGVASCEF